MKKRDLTQSEKNLIVQYKIDQYEPVSHGDEPVSHGDEDYEIEIKESVETAILFAVDTKFGTYILCVNLVEDVDGDIQKTFTELLLLDHTYSNIINVRDNDYFNSLTY